MKRNLLIILFSIVCFSTEAQIKYGEVKLNDSTFIYYFDFFNDQRSFEWDTVPKNFNFDNYRFYFKNNSEDTLWSGRVTTGDGRVTYHYAGHQQMILPNEYFIIKPMHNGSIQYRNWKFSRSVSMTALNMNDSVMVSSHRYNGFYSKDTVLVNQPRIKLEEPLNPYPDGLETRIKQERYEQRMRENEERTAKRKLEWKQKSDSIQMAKGIATKSNAEINLTVDSVQKARVNTKLPVNKELYLRLTFRGRELDSTDQVFFERSNDLIRVESVKKNGSKKQYVIPNSDSLEQIRIVVKNAQGRTQFSEKIDANVGPYIALNIELSGFSGTYSPYDPELKEKTLREAEEKLAKQNFTISIVSVKLKNITNECEFQVFRDGKWVDVQKSHLDSGIGVFNYSTVVDDYRKQIRWKLKTADTWIEDWLYLKRYSHQIFTDPELVNMYGLTGRYNVEMLKNEYRFEHSYSSRDVFASGTSFLDSVKSVFRWYGIPYNGVNHESIKISNKDDLTRTLRALRKHFGEVDLLPLIKGRNESDWLCGDVRLEFLSGISNEDATKLLSSLGYRDFNVSSTPNSEGKLMGSIQLSNCAELKFYPTLKKLFERQELYSLTLNGCGKARLDNDPVPY